MATSITPEPTPQGSTPPVTPVQQPAPPSGGSLVRQPTAADSMPPAEYQEMMKRQLQAAQDQQDAENDLPDAESSNPIVAAWQHLAHRLPRLPDAIASGAVKALTEGATTVESTGLGLYTMPTGDTGSPSLAQLITPDLAKRVADAGGALAFIRNRDEASGWNQAVQHATGIPSDDKVLGMTRNIAQFMTGYELTGPLGKLAEGGGFFAKLGIAGLRGGITEASFFDPKEASLMNVLGSTNIPGLSDLGKALSIHPDDPEINARFKHAMDGGILTVAGEAGLAAAAKLLGYAKMIVKARANGAGDAEVQPLMDKAQEQQNIVNAVAKGKYNAPDDVVRVTPHPDGTGTVEPHRPASDPATRPVVKAPETGGRPTMAAHATADKIEEIAASKGIKIQVSRKGGDVLQIDRIETPADMQGTGVMKDALKEMHAAADENGTTLQTHVAPDMAEGTTEADYLKQQIALRDTMRRNGGYEQPDPRKSFMVREPNAPDNPFQEQERPPKPEEQIPVANAEAAAGDAESLNNAVRAQTQGNSPVTPQLVERYRTVVRRMSNATSDEDMATLIRTTRFNETNYASEPPTILAQKAALEKVFKDEFAANPQSWQETFAKARKFIPPSDVPLTPGSMPELADPELAARTLASDMITFQMQNDVARLSEMMDARPGDPILADNMRTGVDNFMQMTKRFTDSNSEIARALNIMKARGKFRDFMKAARNFKVHEDFSKSASEMLQKGDGFTLDPRTGKPVTKGYSVGRGRTGGEQVVMPKEQVTPETISAAAEKNRDFLAQNPDYHMGGWVKDGQAYIEPVEVFPRRGPAIRAGMKAGEEGIGDLAKYAKGEDGFIATGGSAEGANAPGAQARTEPKYTDGMTDEEVAAVGRLIRMTDGDIRDVEAIVEATAQIKNTMRERLADSFDAVDAEGGSTATKASAKVGLVVKNSLAAIRESFINRLLGSPKTQAVITASGVNNMMFDNVARWTAGVVTRNPALRQQAGDQMYGLFRELGDNLASGKLALTEGRSVINPMPDTHVVGGLSGNVIRLPSRALGANHEFLLAANYRSFVRGQSMDMARAAGLSGDALEQRVAQDLAASFDKDTGIALNQKALDYALDQTYQSPLRKGSLPYMVQRFAAQNPNARWILPFWRTGVNLFDKTWQWTPGLNMFNANARAIMAEGGDEAAVLHMKSVMATTIAAGVYMAASAGNVTGDGPRDPAIRKMWLQNNQPNSFRFGKDSPWIDYARMEPWATTIGSIANFHELTQEWGSKKSDAKQDIMFAVPAAIVANLANKTYFDGISRMSDMITSGDPEKYNQFMRRTVVAATPVPFGGTIAAMNPDPYFREVRSLLDAEKAAVPGLSNTLDPKFNIFGEPTLKNPHYVQRVFLPFFKHQDVSHSVEDDMVELNAHLVPWPEQFSIPGVQSTIDLTDKTAFAQGAVDPKKSPWIRFNELLRNPADGSVGFREKLDAMVQGNWVGADWESTPGRVPGFTGSAREDLVKQLKASEEQKAWKQVLEEYPALSDSVTALQRMAAAAKREGPSGVADARQQ